MKPKQSSPVFIFINPLICDALFSRIKVLHSSVVSGSPGMAHTMPSCIMPVHGTHKHHNRAGTMIGMHAQEAPAWYELCPY